VNRAVVRHGIDGLVASGPDAADLAAALSLMLGDASRTQQMGRAGRQRVEAEFSWPRSAAILDRLIDRI
jgi:glycosyltransferase involved in cell wall biosynthesis